MLLFGTPHKSQADLTNFIIAGGIETWLIKFHLSYLLELK